MQPYQNNNQYNKPKTHVNGENSAYNNDLNLLNCFNSLSIANPCSNSGLKDQSSHIDLLEPPEKSIFVLGANNSLRCQYCGDSYSDDLLKDHENDCERRSIYCDGCTEMIPIEIYDYHLSVCAQNLYDTGNNHHHQNGNVYDFHYGNEDQEDEGPEGEEEEEYREEDWNQGQEEYHEHYEEEEEEDEEDDEAPVEFYQYGNNGLNTYEQLMALDNNVVKKGMDQEELKNFPLELYLTEIDGDARCSVCMSDFESGETLRKLNCQHRFHRDCIDTWLEHNITCPICKKFLR